MSHSFSCVYLHIVFSTKKRMNFFQNPDFRNRLHTYLAGIVNNQNCVPIEIGGPSDHIHALIKINHSIAIGAAVKEMKRISSLWVNEQTCNCGKFAWQEGFSAFSVSESIKDRVRLYIRNQEEHHRRLTFEEELSLLLKMHGFPPVERGALNGGL